MNFVAVSGNMTFDPKINAGESGKGPTQLRVAVNKRIKNKSTGEYENQPSYFTIIVWGDDRKLANTLKKGQRVYVTGRLDWRQWEHEGNKRESVEIVADTLSIQPNGSEPSDDTIEWSF